MKAYKLTWLSRVRSESAWGGTCDACGWVWTVGARGIAAGAWGAGGGLLYIMGESLDRSSLLKWTQGNKLGLKYFMNILYEIEGSVGIQAK